MNGIILVNKEKDYTSRDIVNILGKIFNTKKIGHTGTLDPLATGVLVICIGNATTISEVLTAHEKEYIASIILGIETDTLDMTGNIINEKESIIDESSIDSVLKSFIGTYNQEVPKYSAVKVDGKKLYEYARNNEEVILPKKEVTIKNIERISNIKYENGKTIFDIKCIVSKGTYIRSLIRDIGKKLNTYGCMTSLCRTRQGKFKLEDSYTIDEIKNNKYQIIDLNKALDDFYKVKVDDYLENKILNGQILENRYETDAFLFINNKNEALALYKVYDKDNSKIKPWKMLKRGV